MLLLRNPLQELAALLILDLDEVWCFLVLREATVLTMGGVIFDSADIAGFVAAIGSGLPGMYVLRLLGHAQSFVGVISVGAVEHVRLLAIGVPAPRGVADLASERRRVFVNEGAGETMPSTFFFGGAWGGARGD